VNRLQEIVLIIIRHKDFEAALREAAKRKSKEQDIEDVVQGVWLFIYEFLAGQSAALKNKFWVRLSKELDAASDYSIAEDKPLPPRVYEELERACYNSRIKFHPRHQHEGKRSKTELPEKFDPPDSSKEGIPEAVERREANERFWQAAERLLDRAELDILKRTKAGCSLTRIAERRQVTVSCISQVRTRALDKVAKWSLIENLDKLLEQLATLEQHVIKKKRKGFGNVEIARLYNIEPAHVHAIWRSFLNLVAELIPELPQRDCRRPARWKTPARASWYGLVHGLRLDIFLGFSTLLPSDVCRTALTVLRE